MSRRPSHIERMLALPEGELWIFGYGSLMWRPGFPHLEARLARLNGLHRSLCVWSWHHRGTPALPGLVMGLDRGGSVIGRAYRVAAGERADVLDYLHEREMVTPVYRPHLRSMRFDGESRPALVFIVDRAHPQYAGRLRAERAAEVVLRGRGASGGNPEYLLTMSAHLEQLGIHDPWLAEVRDIVGARAAVGVAI
jgi:glutathione-specific gamma-glutamylcyclotransferase